jgi:molybdopterin converting factor small subunit
MATVFIPTPLRKFTNNTAKLEIQGNSVLEVMNRLTEDFPELKRHLINADGKVPSFINIFVDDDDIRNLQQEQTAVKEHTIISIVPAIAGGKEDPIL